MGKDSQRKKTGSDSVLRHSVIKAPIAREFSSGGVVFRKIDGKTLWLIAASNPSKLFPKAVWRLPKGWIDNESHHVPGPMASGRIRADEESLQKAALREVSEEGGVEGRIIKKIGTTKIFFKHPERGLILKFPTFYLMEWVRDLPEGHDEETSEIAWLPYDESYKRLAYPGEKQILKKASILLASLLL